MFPSFTHRIPANRGMFSFGKVLDLTKSIFQTGWELVDEKIISFWDL